MITKSIKLGDNEREIDVDMTWLTTQKYTRQKDVLVYFKYSFKL